MAAILRLTNMYQLSKNIGTFSVTVENVYDKKYRRFHHEWKILAYVL